MNITRLTGGLALLCAPAMRTPQADRLTADARPDGDDVARRSTTTSLPNAGAVRRRTALTSLPAVVLVLVAACSTGDPPTGPTTASSTSTPAPSPIATAQDTATMRGAAYESAKANYAIWMAMQPNKRADLPQQAHQVATQRAIDKANQTNKAIYTNGITATGKDRVISTKVTSYQTRALTLHVCVGGTGRFLKDGKDVTVDPTGKAVPKGKETRVAYLINFVTLGSGTTWKVDSEKVQEKRC